MPKKQRPASIGEIRDAQRELSGLVQETRFVIASLAHYGYKTIRQQAAYSTLFPSRTHGKLPWQPGLIMWNMAVTAHTVSSGHTPVKVGAAKELPRGTLGAFLSYTEKVTVLLQKGSRGHGIEISAPGKASWKLAEGFMQPPALYDADGHCQYASASDVRAKYASTYSGAIVVASLVGECLISTFGSNFQHDMAGLGTLYDSWQLEQHSDIVRPLAEFVGAWDNEAVRRPDCVPPGQ